MRARILRQAMGIIAIALCGCAAPKPYDYTNFRQNRPRSILVLPPLNNGTDVRGTYGYLSTVTRPLAEMGYYVFPVALVDQFLKENGLPGPGEMHQAPLDKFASVFGADAVMYIIVDEYGSKYHLLSSVAIASARAKLLDAKTGMLLWEGGATAQQASGGGGGNIVASLVGAVISQAVNSNADTAHQVSRETNQFLFGVPRRRGASSAAGAGGPALLYGPRHPEGASSIIAADGVERSSGTVFAPPAAPVESVVPRSEWRRIAPGAKVKIYSKTNNVFTGDWISHDNDYCWISLYAGRKKSFLRSEVDQIALLK